MDYIPTLITVQNWESCIFLDPLTGSFIASSYDIKNGKLGNTIELGYPTGGQNNVYVCSPWGKNKRSTLDLVFPLVNLNLMAAQTGTTKVIGATTSFREDELQITSDATQLEKTPTLVNGQDVLYVNLINSVGMETETLTRVTGAPAAAAEYQVTGKDIAFLASEYDDGTTVRVGYYYTTSSDSIEIVQDVRSIPKTLKFFGTAYCKDALQPNKIFKVTIIADQAQPDGNWDWDMAGDSDGATQPMKLEFIPTYRNKVFYRTIIDDPSKAT